MCPLRLSRRMEKVRGKGHTLVTLNLASLLSPCVRPYENMQRKTSEGLGGWEGAVHDCARPGPCP